MEISFNTFNKQFFRPIKVNNFSSLNLNFQGRDSFDYSQNSRNKTFQTNKFLSKYPKITTTNFEKYSDEEICDEIIEQIQKATLKRRKGIKRVVNTFGLLPEDLGCKSFEDDEFKIRLIEKLKDSSLSEFINSKKWLPRNNKGQMPNLTLHAKMQIIDKFLLAKNDTTDLMNEDVISDAKDFLAKIYSSSPYKKEQRQGYDCDVLTYVFDGNKMEVVFGIDGQMQSLSLKEVKNDVNVDKKRNSSSNLKLPRFSMVYVKKPNQSEIEEKISRLLDSNNWYGKNLSFLTKMNLEIPQNQKDKENCKWKIKNVLTPFLMNEIKWMPIIDNKIPNMSFHAKMRLVENFVLNNQNPDKINQNKAYDELKNVLEIIYTQTPKTIRKDDSNYNAFYDYKDSKIMATFSEFGVLITVGNIEKNNLD